MPICSPVSACRHHKKISGGQTNSTKSLPKGNKGYLALKNGLRNQNWPQEGLFSAKILINTCSGRWRRHDVRHDLTCPIWLWKKWIACQTKALTESCKMRVLVTGLNTELGKNFQSSGPSVQPQRAVGRTRVRHLARRPEINLSLMTMVDILNESPYQALRYSHTNLYP